VEINPVLSLDQLVDPSLSYPCCLAGRPTNDPEVGDFLLQQGIIKNAIQADKIVEIIYSVIPAEEVVGVQSIGIRFRLEITTLDNIGSNNPSGLYELVYVQVFQYSFDLKEKKPCHDQDSDH